MSASSAAVQDQDKGRGIKRSMAQMQQQFTVSAPQRKVYLQQGMIGTPVPYPKTHMNGAMPSAGDPQRKQNMYTPGSGMMGRSTNSQSTFPALLCREIYKDPDRAAVQLYSEFHRTAIGKTKLLRFFGNLLHLQSASFMYSSSASAGTNVQSSTPQVPGRIGPIQSHMNQLAASRLQQQQQQQQHQQQQQVRVKQQQQQQQKQQQSTQPRYPRTFLQGKDMVVQLKEGDPYYNVKHFPFVGSAHKGIVYWLGTQSSTGEWSNPALKDADGSPERLVISRSSSAKGSASDAAALAFSNSCTRRTPVIDSNGNHTNWYVIVYRYKHAANKIFTRNKKYRYMFDFKNLRILPTHYSLRHGWKQGKFCLRSWKLEGSINGTSWVTFCQHTDDETLNSSPTNKNTWAFANRPNQNLPWVRFFRVSMTSPNSHGSYTMCLAGFEVYGACIDLSKPVESVATSTNSTTNDSTAPIILTDKC